MKLITIDKFKFFACSVLCFSLFLLFAFFKLEQFQILNTFGFIFLVFAPGFLTVLAIRVRNANLWNYIFLSIGISLFELMIMGLFGNWSLPIFGIKFPLFERPILLEFAILVLFLQTFVWFRWEDLELKIDKYVLFESKTDLFFSLSPFVFVVLSVFGAIRLNNGGDGMISLLSLIGIAVYSIALIARSGRLGSLVIPIAIFAISLALLLMTSLRGWYVTGHDIVREYRVFELTKNNGIWAIANYRDAYNACMSITILPTIISSLLKIADPYVYKIYFQIIFAIVPSIIYLTVRRYTTSAIAFLSVFYFVSFPTFFTDMPMLNRQEIAFVFLSLMIYVMFEESMPLRLVRTIFLAFGVGLILSHYTTTYTIIGILMFAVIARPILFHLGNFIEKKKQLPQFVLNVLRPATDGKARISIFMVIVLAGASFFWTSVLTDTASNSLVRVVVETVKAIKSTAKEDAQSSDVLYSLFSWHSVDSQQLVKQYEKKFVEPLRSSSRDGVYYTSDLYAKYPTKILKGDVLPITVVGNFFTSLGININSFNFFFRQSSAKILQIFILIGIACILFGNKFFKKPLEMEYLLLAAGSLTLLAAVVLLPVLSVEYGLLRAFQQALMLLGSFIVVGSLTLFYKFKSKVQLAASSLIAIVFFLSSTGVFTQTLGGYDPQLHLNNDGIYHDLYYLQTSEIAGLNYLKKLVGSNQADSYQSELVSDRFVIYGGGVLKDSNKINAIYPKIIRKDSYVFLGETNILKKQSTMSYEGTLITYQYPLEFLDDNKNLIYSSGNVRIYK